MPYPPPDTRPEDKIRRLHAAACCCLEICRISQVFIGYPKEIAYRSLIYPTEALNNLKKPYLAYIEAIYSVKRSYIDVLVDRSSI